MNPAVSFIVPIFNSEQFLERCFDSIAKQPFTDFEVLLIDDGSTDSSKTICQKKIAEDSRFGYFYKQNGGLSSARNHGMERAVGKYIAFLDSDDFIDENFCQILVSYADQNEAEIVNFGYANVKKESSFIINSPLPKACLVERSRLIELISRSSENGLLYFAWSNFFRRDFIVKHNLTFNESVLLGEDSVFNLQAFLLARRLFSIQDCLYFYVHNDNSLTQRPFKENLLSKFQSQFEHRIWVHSQFPEITGPKFENDIARNYLENALFMLFSNIRNSQKPVVDQFITTYNSELYQYCIPRYSDSGKISIFMRIKIWLFRKQFFKLLSRVF